MGTDKKDSGQKKRLRARFAGAILGTMTALGTVAGMMSTAEAQNYISADQARVNAFVLMNDQLRLLPETPYYENNARAISQLYAAMHDYALYYADKPINSMTFLDDIGHLGNTYGLLRGNSYRVLTNMINTHSFNADTYHIGMMMQGGDGSDYLPESPGFLMTKADALKGVGTALATYIEEVYQKVEQAGGFSSQNAYNAFGRVCRFHQAIIGQFATLDLPDVQRQVGRYTLENSRGQSITCPPRN